MSVEKFLQIAPPLASIVCFIAPFPSIRNMVAHQTTGEVPALTFVSMAVMCSIWGTYGGLRNNTSVLVTNLFGCALSIYYLWVFERYTSKGARMAELHRWYRAGIALLGMLLLYIFYSDVEAGAQVVGTCGAVLSVIFASSPLLALPTIYKSRSLESMPFFTSLMMFASGFLWFLHGWVLANDSSIYIPNFVGSLVSGVQILIHLVFAVGLVAGSTSSSTSGGLVRQASL